MVNSRRSRPPCFFVFTVHSGATLRGLGDKRVSPVARRGIGSGGEVGTFEPRRTGAVYFYIDPIAVGKSYTVYPEEVKDPQPAGGGDGSNDATLHDYKERAAAALALKALTSHGMADNGVQQREVENSSDEDTSVDSEDDRLPRENTYTAERVDAQFFVNTKAKSLFCLPADFGPRRACIWLVQKKWFDWLSIGVIVVNCLFLATWDPTQDDNSAHNQVLFWSEIVFTVIFTIEMCIRIIARGLIFHKYAYLRDPWNWIDFLVVMFGYISLIPGVANFSVLRTFRLLRPLRTLSTIPGLRVLVKSLLLSIPALINVMVLCVFIFFIFGLIAIQLYQGLLRQRCHVLSGGVYTVDEDNSDRSCSTSGGEEFWVGRPCSLEEDTANDGSVLASALFCRIKTEPYVNPNFSLTHFDDMAASFLTIFQCISMEGWTDVMYLVSDAQGHTSDAYFVLMILFGSMFLVNLMLAVITDKYDEASRDEKNQPKDNSVKKPSMWEKVKACFGCGKKEDPNEEEEDSGDESSTNDPLGLKKSSKSRPASAASGAETSAESLEREKQEQEEKEAEAKRLARGPPPPYNKWCFPFFNEVVNSKIFSGIILILILINTIVLASDHYPSNASFDLALSIANYILTACFFVEMCLKWLGLGFINYFKDPWNLFDCIIVWLSLLDIIITLSNVSEGSGISVLRTFRLMRILKLARQWTGLQRILTTMIRTIPQISNFAIVLVLFVFIYALLGMQLFGNKFNFDDGLPRANFDSLVWACTTIFQILTGENWNTVMYDGMRATTWMACLYFVSVVVVGTYVVLNLFLAMLLSNFDTTAEEKDDGDKRTWREKIKMAIKQKKIQLLWNKPKKDIEDDEVGDTSGADPDQPTAEKGTAEYPLAPSDGRATPATGTALVAPEEPEVNPSQGDLTDRKGKPDMVTTNLMAAMRQNVERNEREANAKADPKAAMEAEVFGESGFEADDKNDGEIEQLDWPRNLPRLNGRSLFIFKTTNTFRLGVARIVLSRYFDYTIFALIFLSSLLLAIENPRDDPNDDKGKALTYANIVLTVLFLLESFVKILVHGFLFHEGAYLLDGWNLLDFLIVLVSVVGLFISSDEFKSLKALRALRALRPLRLINRVPGLKIVVNSIFRSVPAIINVCFISFIFWLIFAILGVQLFKGRFSVCSNAAATDKDNCEALGGEWEAPTYGFDNTAEALLTLFEVSTLEGWVDVMYSGVDAGNIEQQPQRDRQEWMIIYFVAFVIIGSFFILNLFVGVVIDNFNDIRDEYTGSAFMSPQQKEWVDTQRYMLYLQPRKKLRPPGGSIFNDLRKPFFFLVTDRRFEFFIMFLIMCNVAVMATKHYGQPAALGVFQDVMNYIFTTAFLIEAILKLIGLGKYYFKDNWNRFDLTIVILSILGIALQSISDVGTAITLLRVFRVARIFRLVKTSRSLRLLFQTLIRSLPSLVNVGSLLLLLFFVYAVMGMNLYGNIVPRTEAGVGNFLNDHANFQNFYMSMLTLFRMSTGEVWNGIMHDCMISQDSGCSFVSGANNQCECIDSEGYCGNSWAPVYFVSFVVLAQFMLLNLFIAVLLENFSEQSRSEDATLKQDDLEQFQATWAEFDPEATGYIDRDELANFVMRIDEPLGLGPGVSRPQVVRLIARLKIKDRGGKVNFHEVLLELATNLVRQKTDVFSEEWGEDLQGCEMVKMLDVRKRKMEAGLNEASDYPVQAHFAAIYIQSIVRGFMARRKEAKEQAELEAARKAQMIANGEEEEPLVHKPMTTQLGNFAFPVSRPAAGSVGAGPIAAFPSGDPQSRDPPTAAPTSHFGGSAPATNAPEQIVAAPVSFPTGLLPGPKDSALEAPAPVVMNDDGGALPPPGINTTTPFVVHTGDSYPEPKTEAT